MLPRADMTGTRPVVLVEASLPATTVGQPRQETLERLLQLSLGKEYQAQVMSRLTDGRFLVNIGNAAASMKLPAGTKAGDTLDLTLLAREPRPTFLLGRSEASASTSLSNAGRLIDSMLQMAQQDGGKAAVVGRTPLLPSAAALSSSAQLAGSMRQAVNFSGLFYESHVAQWAAGSRSVNDLLREPLTKRSSASLTTSLTGLPSAATAAAGGTETAAQRLSTTLTAAIDKATAENARALSSSSSLSERQQDTIQALTARAQQAPDAPLLEQARLLNQQLDTLEQRRFLWQGELLPGQPLEWEISDDTPRQPAEQSPPEAAWSSTVRFALPSLGTIAATVHLSGNSVRLQITTPDEAVADLLQAHGTSLADSLAAAGSQLDALLVRQKD